MKEAASGLDQRIARRVRELRATRGLSLDELASKSGVSRSMISLVERAESSPTAAVLDRLSAGLGVTLASLFADEARADASPLSRRAEQARWRDPASGYVRRNLSPLGFPSPIELVEVLLPAKARVAYVNAGNAPRIIGISQQVWVIAGRIELTVGKVIHQLSAGDCLAMRLDQPTAFHNPARQRARYLVALTTDPAGRLEITHPSRGKP